MADEIRVTCGLNFNKGGANPNRQVTDTFDVAGTNYSSGVQNIGTSEEQITTTDVGVPGYVFIKNLDATNFIQIGTYTGAYHMRLNAGEFCCYRCDVAGTEGIFLKADTAACDVEFLIIET